MLVGHRRGNGSSCCDKQRRGRRNEIEDDVRLSCGIPYAQPPIGELRWRASRPVESWNGTHDASEYGPICPQPRRGNVPQSEDCLTLNIWIPLTVDEPLPMMVWIHGGAQIQGSGRINGSSFARNGIVLVSINCRLGRFGVFAHPQLSASLEEGEATGNFHLLDQIEALRWIQEEISAFGGDPSKVTIFGVSAGGSNVNLLMTSPLSKGLFDRAISQSAANGLSRLRNLQTQEGFGARLTESKQVETFADLRALPWESIAESDASSRNESGPIIDGTVVVESVAESFQAGRKHDVPYVAGANSFEGSLRAAIPILAFDRMLEGDRENIAAAYGLEPNDPSLDLEFYGDMLFVAPTRFLVKQMRTVEAPAWQYHFDYVIEAMDEHLPGASHGTEVRYVFNLLSTVNLPRRFAQRLGLPEGEYKSSEADMKAAAMTHGYWVQFAKTGNPNAQGLPSWPAYKSPNPATLLISNDGIGAQLRLRDSQLDLIERRVLR